MALGKIAVSVAPIPILEHADTLVIGGTMAACIAAHDHACRGRRTVLAAFDCSLPYEFCVYRRPWISDDEIARLPEPFAAAFRESIGRETAAGEPLLNLAKLAIRVEDVLLDAGVRIFYGMTPCGALPAGVVFGGKFGLRAIAAEEIIDGTPRLRLREGESAIVRIAAKVGVSDQETPITGDRGQRNTCPTEWPEESVLEVPGVDALVAGRVDLHGPYAEFVLRLPVQNDTPFRLARLSAEARRVLVEIGSRLTEQRRAAGKRQLFFHRFSGGLLFEPHALGDAPQLRAAVPHARGESPHELCCADAPVLHATTESVELGDMALPVLAECDVLVAGGGTAGVPAALATAQSGARTVLLEQHADVGGVRTVGGVASYWFGRETPWQRACDDAYDACSGRCGMAEEIAMLHCLREASVEVLAGCAIVGVVRQGDVVLGAVVATERGLGVVRGRVFVDATGDADLAAWAGAPCAYGNGRDAWTMWASFANFNEEKRTASRQYDSAIETRDPYDFARTVITGRRRQGMWSRFAHEMPQHYVAPRESRRIVGRATVSYGDILAGETFPDVMTVCDSNFDIKGIASSDLIYSGVVWAWRARTTYLAPVPYRAVLPQGLANVLVTGRAWSATHDALSLARMQRDMVSLGASVGIAAAQAAATGTPPAELDVTALQKEWVRRGTLRKADLRRLGRQPAAYTEADAERDARAVLANSGRLPQRLARLMRSPVSLGPLRRAFAAASDGAAKVNLARALCYLGDDSAVPFLLDTIVAQTAKRLPLPYRKTLAKPPEHGWAPAPVYSLHAIALAGRGRAAAPLLAAIAAKVPDDAGAFASKSESPFEYVREICAVAERAPGPEMVPALEALHAKRCLCGLAIGYGDDARGAVDSVLERRAYLELCIGRALARCADRRGYDILLAYVDDMRGTLARSAADELHELLGEPPQPGREGWQQVVDERADATPPKPWTQRIE